MKSQADRIKDVADRLRRGARTDGAESGCVLIELHDVNVFAAALLEAADREPPTWPTDESVEAFCRVVSANGGYAAGARRPGLRAALLADPIIKAAIAYRDVNGPTRQCSSLSGRLICDAVDEAGL